MAQTPSLTTEVANIGNYPGRKLSKRERKVLASAQAYIDSNVGAASIGSPVGSGTTGSLLFVGAGPVLAQSNAQVFWDNTNSRLGIGTAAPGTTLDVTNANASGSAATIRINNAASNGSTLVLTHAGTGRALRIQQTGTGSLNRGIDIEMTNATNAQPGILITATTVGKAIAASTNTGTTAQSTATFDNLSTTMTGIGHGVYGSVRTSASATTAGVTGEVVGSGIGYGFFSIRNSAGKCLALGTNLGAGIGLSCQYAMSAGNNYNLELPLVQGAANQMLLNDGTGVFTWVGTQGTGGVNTAGALYTSNEQGMIQAMWDALRTYKILS